MFKKNLFVFVMVLSFMFGGFISNTYASEGGYQYEDYMNSIYMWEYSYNRTVDIYPYQTKDVYTLFKMVRTGQLTKEDLVFRLIDQANCNFTYSDNTVNIECYNGDDCVYNIMYDATKDLLCVDFYDCTFNNKHSYTTASVINSMKAYSKVKGYTPTIIKNKEEGIYSESIYDSSKKWEIDTYSSYNRNCKPGIVRLYLI